MDGIVDPASPEQAADLAALQACVEPGSEGTPELEPVGPDFGIEASQLTDMIAALIVGYEPKCAPVWGEDRKAGIAAALAPVLEKYNFTLGNIPPELTLLMLAGPPLYQSMKIIADGMQPKPESRTFEHEQQQPNPTQSATHSPEMMNL